MGTVIGIGDRIRKQRRKRRMSQKQLADRLCITQSTVSSYEANRALPSIEALYQLAIIFDCTTDYLLDLDNRRFIYVDNITPRQEEAVRRLVDAIASPYDSGRHG